VEAVLADDIISREDALAQGLRFYFTGTPCKHGHLSPRYVSSKNCAACLDARYRSDRQGWIDRVRVWQIENKEHRSAYEKAYWAQRPEAVKAIRKRHYEAYRQQESERNRIYKSINRAKIAATDRKWRSANPEKRHVYACNRRARFRLAEGRHTAEDIVRIYQAQAGKCAYCKIRLGRKYHVDHIVALTKGGSNWPRNIQLLCGPCNIRKRDHDPLDYARSRGLLL